ncbi:MAG: type II secretion system protein, partial [Thermodesulfobacteriota bacterium]
MNIEKKGFTLIEMAIVLVVIGLIVGTIVPLLVTQTETAKLKQGKEKLRAIRDEVIGYAYQHNKRLPDLAEFENLGHSRDLWGDDYFFYRVASDLTTMNICDAKDNSTMDLRLPDGDKKVAFVVSSKGPNFVQQINDNGSMVKVYPVGSDVNNREFDDLYEYVTLGHLQSKLCSSADNGDSGDGGTDISFAKNIAEFNHIIESQNGVINVDENSKTITIGGSEDLASGCIWYGQDTGPCTEGVCDLGSGFRAFFRFKSTHEDTSSDS